MPKKKTKKKETIQNDSFIFIMLLATISTLAVALKDYTFSMIGINITFSIFIIPFILLLFYFYFFSGCFFQLLPALLCPISLLIISQSHSKI